MAPDDGIGERCVWRNVMPVMLRSVLVIASVLTTLLIMRKIRKGKMMIEDSLFWIGFSFMLILFSIFPQIVFKMSDLVGTQSASNFIFQMSMKISQMEAKFKDLVVRMAIDENIRNEQKEEMKS